MVVRLNFCIISLSFALCSFGCSTPTEIVVVVDTDLAVGEISTIAVEITGPDGELRRSTKEYFGTASPPATVGLVYDDEGPTGPLVVRAVGLLGQDEVIERRAEVSFVSERIVVLSLPLLRSCVGTTCQQDETCAEEGCRPVLVSGSEMIDWSGSPPRLDGGLPDGDSDNDSGDEPENCAGDEPRCDGDVLVRCESGRQVEERCALGCAVAEGRCLRLAPSTIDRELWSQATFDVTVGSMTSVDTDLCAPGVFTPAAYTETVEVSGGPDLCIVVVSSLTVAAGATLEAFGSRSLVVFATGEVVINGTVDAGAHHDRPGSGGGTGGGPDADSPDALCGGGAGQNDGTRDSGGGGGGFGGSGGNGGNADAIAGGQGGESRGVVTLTPPLLGGCGGGGGASQPGSGDGGYGGGGGGALQMSAGSSILISGTGTVISSGGGGGGGTTESGGGGGGSGGAVLLEAPDVMVEGVVATNGGGGGASNGGEDGSDGTPNANPALGGPDPGGNAERGGDGGAGAAPDGEVAPEERFNGGGGGGGTGRVRINSSAGVIVVTGTVSPSTAATFTQGTVETW